MNSEQETNHAFARSRSNAGLGVTALEQDALEHIARNGNLLFWRGESWQAKVMFEKLEREGRIERNKWSGRWMLTPNVKLTSRPLKHRRKHDERKHTAA